MARASILTAVCVEILWLFEMSASLAQLPIGGKTTDPVTGVQVVKGVPTFALGTAPLLLQSPITLKSLTWSRVKWENPESIHCHGLIERHAKSFVAFPPRFFVSDVNFSSNSPNL